jgi:hypothetical protein
VKEVWEATWDGLLLSDPCQLVWQVKQFGKFTILANCFTCRTNRQGSGGGQSLSF